MDLTIRTANSADIDVLVAFQLNMALETETINLDETIVRKGVKAVFDDRSKGEYLVAIAQEKVIGSLLLTYEWSDWRNGTVLWIQSVYVSPEFRGQGVYKKLYDYVKGMLDIDLNLKGIRLYVDKTNTIAQKVYKNLGMNGEHYKVFEWMKS